MHNFDKYNYTNEQLSERVDIITGEKLVSEERLSALKLILGLIDLTTLSGDDNIEKVTNLCKKALSFENTNEGIPNVAAVCVYPVFSELVSKLLVGSGLNTACVAGAFPSGLSPIELREKEVSYAVEKGADEIDIVISRGRLIEGDDGFVAEEVKRLKSACGDAHLKVILETGELKSIDLVRKASEISINSGGDFLKTSTGKISPAATHDTFLVMLDTIKEYYEKTGIQIGIKAAGGISTPDEAVSYYLLVKHVLGEKWLNNKYFRIGASRLADNVLNEILKA
jgi:deoxyribose-phosphate aldolase